MRSSAIERLDTIEQRGATFEHHLASTGSELTHRLGEELRERSAARAVERLYDAAAAHPIALAAGAFAAAFFTVRIVRT